jgi:hypothetical protein
MAIKSEFVWKRSWPNSRHHSDINTSEVNQLQKSLWAVLSGLQLKNSALHRVRSMQTNHSALTPDECWELPYKVLLRFFWPLKYLVNVQIIQRTRNNWLFYVAASMKHSKSKAVQSQAWTGPEGGDR